MEKLTLNVDGMSCGHCVARVSKTLNAVPGVKVGEVTIGSASLEFDPAVVSPQKITTALDEAGYPARQV